MTGDQRLWAITCYFNPIHYQSRRLNYRVFRRRLGIPLLAVELSFDEISDLGRDDADILVSLHGGDILWQKERLLNLALGALPGSCEIVAWLDCDIVFERDDWADATARLLESYRLVQHFETVVELRGGAERPRDAVARAACLSAVLKSGLAPADLLRSNMRVKHSCHSGLAWAVRRELLEPDGFYDACILGSGNRAMACAALGRFEDAEAYLAMSPSWTRHYLAWARPHFERIQGSIGHIPGTVYHLWHGSLFDRRYAERHIQLQRHGYDPITDIAIDASGSWRWNSNKPDLHDFVIGYFQSRREDGSPSGPLHSQRGDEAVLGKGT